ncbi:glycosyltransferase [Paracoccus aerodenitrificans]|uniref:glycosyltransferase n=1 Tax=Paracoccus aerodenitrificans TaxID=3017781 RepID=UPI0022F06F8B|nr:glycosyltransferase [Paracoccus aerodenitrificans]WBU63492.1 glycosyltransferase [Paracoccus aerodenitrificans]
MAKRQPSSAPLHIVHVTEASLGGVATYLEELLTAQIEGLPEARIDLLSPEINRDALSGVNGKNFHFIGFPHKRSSKKDLITLGWRTIQHLRRVKPDIVHIHSTFAGAAIRGLAPLIPRRTKVIYCPHGWAFSRHGSRRMQRSVAAVERVLSRATDRIICISDYELSEALNVGIPDRKLTVINNGVSPRPALPSRSARNEGQPRLIAFAGRFDRQKGYDTFLQVMRKLGDSARGAAIGSAIVSADKLPEVPENVDLLGWQPRQRVFELFSRADLLLVPSRWEGFGLVAVEAMQARLPVFASRVGGLQDIVIDHETGRLFTPDAVEEIVAAIRASSDTDLRRYGEQSYRRYLQKYTADRMAGQVDALYRNLLNCATDRT